MQFKWVKYDAPTLIGFWDAYCDGVHMQVNYWPHVGAYSACASHGTNGESGCNMRTRGGCEAKYATLEDAIAAAEGFCKQLQLPRRHSSQIL